VLDSSAPISTVHICSNKLVCLQRATFKITTLKRHLLDVAAQIKLVLAIRRGHSGLHSLALFAWVFSFAVMALATTRLPPPKDSGLPPPHWDAAKVRNRLRLLCNTSSVASEAASRMLVAGMPRDSARAKLFGSSAGAPALLARNLCPTLLPKQRKDGHVSKSKANWAR